MNKAKKKACPSCRHEFGNKFAQNPRINTALTVAIRAFKAGDAPKAAKAFVRCVRAAPGAKGRRRWLACRVRAARRRRCLALAAQPLLIHTTLCSCRVLLCHPFAAA